MPDTKDDRRATLTPDSDLLFFIDASVIALISAAICAASGHLAFMTALVPVVIVLRTAAVVVIEKREGRSAAAEIVFLLICTVLGAFNDWNSVVHKRIYDYAVPHYVSFSTIPVWMLLFWGMILRFVARLARWIRLDPPERPHDGVRLAGRWIENGPLKVALLLMIVFGTRAFIYRTYLDPLYSWLPFLVALGLTLVTFKVTRHDIELLALFLVGGPLIEALYIQVGGLHRYHLGWIGGVPLWIALWWLVAVFVWKDLSLRLQTLLARHLRA